MGRFRPTDTTEADRQEPRAPTARLAIVDPRSAASRFACAWRSPSIAPTVHVTEGAEAQTNSSISSAPAVVSFSWLISATSHGAHRSAPRSRRLLRAIPDTPLVVVAETDAARSARGSSSNRRARLSAGVAEPGRVLMGAIDLVLAGGVYVPSSLIESASQRQGSWQGSSQAAEPWSELTRRQRDVLALIAQGKSNKLIADALTMSESTVKAHVKQIIKRLNVANRTQAALVATGRAFFAPHLRTGNGVDVVAARD